MCLETDFVLDLQLLQQFADYTERLRLDVGAVLK